MHSFGGLNFQLAGMGSLAHLTFAGDLISWCSGYTKCPTLKCLHLGEAEACEQQSQVRPCFHQSCLWVTAVSFPAPCHSVLQLVGRAQCHGKTSDVDGAPGGQQSWALHSVFLTAARLKLPTQTREAPALYA